MRTQQVAAMVDGARTPVETACRMLLVLAGSTRVLAIADQALVSGTSFLTTVAIGRFTAPSELGIYALSMSLLITATNFQNTLISQPYTLHRHQPPPPHRPPQSDAERAGSSLALAMLMSLAAALAVAAVAAGMALVGNDAKLAAITATLAAVAPFLLLRELIRDFGFARLEIREVVILDATVGATQFAALACLVLAGRMSAATALLCVGTACGVAAAVGLFLGRRGFVVRPADLPQAARDSWKLGKWFLASTLSFSMQVQFSYWLIGALAGTAAIGIYAACMSVASLANPLLTGINRPMLAHSALTIKHGGRRQLLHATICDTLLIGTALAVFCAVILVAGEKILHLLYASRDYAGNYWLVVMLAFWHFEQALAMPPANALAVMGLARANFHIGLVSTILSTLVVLCLVASWGPLGAGVGLLVGTAAGCVLRWIAVVRGARAPAVAANLARGGG